MGRGGAERHWTRGADDVLNQTHPPGLSDNCRYNGNRDDRRRTAARNPFWVVVRVVVRWGAWFRMPRFVLLEHTWNGVHWDLMLERDGVLRTWAIDAPVVSGRDLPARSLGDHRLVYLDYEGEISGGRGRVR